MWQSDGFWVVRRHVVVKVIAKKCGIKNKYFCKKCVTSVLWDVNSVEDSERVLVQETL